VVNVEIRTIKSNRGLTRIVESIVEIRLRRGRLAGDGGISRIAYRVSRIAYLGEKRVLREKGRGVNQRNHNESIRQAQDRFAGFFNRPGGQSFTEAAAKCTGHL